MFTIQDLSFAIGEKAILQQVTASFEKNCFTAIIGKNGSGKSTLLSFLNKVRPSEKAVSYGGRLLEEYSLNDFARHVAVLPQNNKYLYNLYVHEIVLMGRYPYKKGFSDYTEEDHAIMNRALIESHVSHLKNRRIRELSGGELQRVLIAKVFAQETETILFDEPTNHLDVKHKIDLMKLLKGSGKTIIAVLHDLSLVRMFCDDVLILDEGKVVASGAVKDLMVPSVLNDIFEVNFTMHREGDVDLLNYY